MSGMFDRSSLKPVAVAGIEFDALIDESKTMGATIPEYPVEDGFSVSDTMILEPLAISLTLYLTDTPVTWLYRHGSSRNRVRLICEQLESMWMKKETVKIVTNSAIYTSMGITSIKITHADTDGYAKKITIDAKKVQITEKKTTLIPAYALQSGKSNASAGTASTSTESSRSASVANSGGSSGSSATTKSESKKGQSILYGAAKGLGFIK